MSSRAAGVRDLCACVPRRRCGGSFSLASYTIELLELWVSSSGSADTIPPPNGGGVPLALAAVLFLPSFFVEAVSWIEVAAETAAESSAPVEPVLPALLPTVPMTWPNETCCGGTTMTQLVLGHDFMQTHKSRLVTRNGETTTGSALTGIVGACVANTVKTNCAAAADSLMEGFNGSNPWLLIMTLIATASPPGAVVTDTFCDCTACWYSLEEEVSPATGLTAYETPGVAEFPWVGLNDPGVG